MYQGSCLCGAVAYTYGREIAEVAICHCSQCRRAQGTPFVTNAPVATEAFRWLRGEDRLKSHYASANKRRVFCADCGSPLFSQRMDRPEVMRLRLGTLEGNPPLKPSYHIYWDSRVSWFECHDDLPKYAEGKP